MVGIVVLWRCKCDVKVVNADGKFTQFHQCFVAALSRSVGHSLYPERHRFLNFSLLMERTYIPEFEIMSKEPKFAVGDLVERIGVLVPRLHPMGPSLRRLSASPIVAAARSESYTRSSISQAVRCLLDHMDPNLRPSRSWVSRICVGRLGTMEPSSSGAKRPRSGWSRSCVRLKPSCVTGCMSQT
jgi:hypothetical protein